MEDFIGATAQEIQCIIMVTSLEQLCMNLYDARMFGFSLKCIWQYFSPQTGNTLPIGNIICSTTFRISLITFH